MGAAEAKRKLGAYSLVPPPRLNFGLKKVII